MAKRSLQQAGAGRQDGHFRGVGCRAAKSAAHGKHVFPRRQVAGRIRLIRRKAVRSGPFKNHIRSGGLHGAEQLDFIPGAYRPGVGCKGDGCFYCFGAMRKLRSASEQIGSRSGEGISLGKGAVYGPAPVKISDDGCQEHASLARRGGAILVAVAKKLNHGKRLRNTAHAVGACANLAGRGNIIVGAGIHLYAAARIAKNAVAGDGTG